MPKGSEERTKARKEEIIDACASLYTKRSFREISIRDIGNVTSFTRTSIYNYFETKEEIFLALLEREYTLWKKDLEHLFSSEEMSAESFSSALASSLEKRSCMLRLITMNLYDMESASRIENLTSFKKIYSDTLDVLSTALRKFFKGISDDDVKAFIYAFFPFLFGVYPYTSVTDKQKTAMENVGFKGEDYSIFDIVKSFVFRFLKSFG